VSCYDLPRVKAAVRSIRFDAVRAVANQALACASAAPVRALVRERIDALMPSYLALDRDAPEAEPAAVAAPAAKRAEKRAEQSPTRQLPRPAAKLADKPAAKLADKPAAKSPARRAR
jgi:hypothetical protein